VEEEEEEAKEEWEVVGATGREDEKEVRPLAEAAVETEAAEAERNTLLLLLLLLLPPDRGT